MKALLAAILLALAMSVHADELLMVRSTQAFEETMSSLQNAITRAGYKLSRVQRVDVGMEGRGYKTDKYRVVFYAKPDEVTQLSAAHPELIPYLPLNIAIFAEDDNTIVVTSRPGVLAELFPDPALKPIFTRWEKDLRKILDEVSEEKWRQPGIPSVRGLTRMGAKKQGQEKK